MRPHRLLEFIALDKDPWEIRRLDCPDGVTRLVPLRVWRWEELDMLERDHGLIRKDFIREVFAEALKSGGELAYYLSAWMEYSIIVEHCRRIRMAKHNLANDAWENPYWPPPQVKRLGEPRHSPVPRADGETHPSSPRPSAP